MTAETAAAPGDIEPKPIVSVNVDLRPGGNRGRYSPRRGKCFS